MFGVALKALEQTLPFLLCIPEPFYHRQKFLTQFPAVFLVVIHQRSVIQSPDQGEIWVCLLEAPPLGAQFPHVFLLDGQLRDEPTMCPLVLSLMVRTQKRFNSLQCPSCPNPTPMCDVRAVLPERS